jgi:hypothetical protein
MDVEVRQNGRQHNEWTWSDSGWSLPRTRIDGGVKVEPHVLRKQCHGTAKMLMQRPLRDSYDLNE